MLYDLLSTICPALTRCGNATVVINSSNINTSPVEDMRLVDCRKVLIHLASALNIYADFSVTKLHCMSDVNGPVIDT